MPLPLSNPRLPDSFASLHEEDLDRDDDDDEDADDDDWEEGDDDDNWEDNVEEAEEADDEIMNDDEYCAFALLVYSSPLSSLTKYLIILNKNFCSNAGKRTTASTYTTGTPARVSCVQQPI